MAYTAPTSTVAGQLVTSSFWNTNSTDNIAALFAGALGVASQAAGDVFYASSASQVARLAKGTALQVLRMNSGATAPEWGTVGIKSIQSGEITIAASGTSNTATITSVNTAKSYVIHRGHRATVGGFDVAEILATVTLTSATVVTAARGKSNGNALIVGYTVIEFE